MKIPFVYSKALNTLKAVFGNVFTVISTITAAVSVVYAAVSENKYGGIVSLSALCFFFLFLLLSLVSFVKRVFKKNLIGEYGEDSPILDHGCDTILMSVHYDSNGTGVKYDSIKTVQCKKLLVTHYPHRFKWSGTKDPQPSSNNQKFTVVKKGDDQEKFDVAILELKKPLIYNETEVIHLRLDADDADKKSDKHITIKMNEYIRTISATITLRHLDNLPAIHLQRFSYKSQTGTAKIENVQEVPFDSQTKSYHFVIHGAELGFVYKFSWEHLDR